MSKVFISYKFRDRRHMRHLGPITDFLEREGLAVSYIKPEHAKPLRNDNGKLSRLFLKFLTYLFNVSETELILKVFPRLHPVLTRMRTILQHNLEASDTFLYLVPSHTSIRDPWDDLTKDLARIQWGCFIPLLGPFAPILTGLFLSTRPREAKLSFGSVWPASWSFVRARMDSAKEKVEHYVLPLWMSSEKRLLDTLYRRSIRSQHYDRADKLIEDALGGVPESMGVQKPIGANEVMKILNEPSRKAQTYQRVYGIEMPKPPNQMGEDATKSWQEWELETARALGLNIVKVALLEDFVVPSSIPKDAVSVRISDLENDLEDRVLPGLKEYRRKPLRVHPKFFKNWLLSKVRLCLLGALVAALLIWFLVALIHWIAT